MTTRHIRAHFRGVVTTGTQRGARLHSKLFGGLRAHIASNNLLYQGGSVMHSDANYSIYWEPAGYATTSSYKTVIDSFFSNVAAASGAATNDYSVATQYYDGTGQVAYRSSFGGRTVVSDAYPASGCVASGRPCLTDAQLESELNKVISSRGLPRGLGTIYYIFTAPGVATCFDSSGSDCSSGGSNFDYCAYHSWLGSGSSTTLYAVMPYAALSGCDSGERPNADPADATLNVTSHENIEAVTDPTGQGWYDASGEEIGDKCGWNFGTALGGGYGALYNEQIATGNYWLQEEWSNLAGGCVQRPARSQPAAAFTVSPTAPTSGQSVSFNASSSSDSGATITSYSWSFGDGTAGSGVQPGHTYWNAGTYAVKLTITDSFGRTATVSHTVTITSRTSRR